MTLWAIRIPFLILCVLTGYAISQVQPDVFNESGPNGGGAMRGMVIGFGFGGLLIAIDEMLKGFSLRAFSAATFGLVLGTTIAWLIDRTQLFIYVEEYPVRWVIRLALFVGFSYIGMVLAMRSNKEDFSLIIPYVRFAPQNRPESLVLLDTSVIIDGRIADLIEARFVSGSIIVPRFVLKELQLVADSADPVRRARGRRGLDMLSRIQRNPNNEVKIHEADVPEEKETDAKLVHLARLTNAVLYTNDYNLGKIAELQHVRHVNLNELASALKPVVLPGEVLRLGLIREGKDKEQAVGYLPDGTMVVVNHGKPQIGREVDVQVLSLLQTATGTLVFADLKGAPGRARGAEQSS